MLRFFLLSVFVFLFCFNQAQIIPNNDLENWTSDGEFLNPNGWDCSNRSFFSLLSFTTTTRDAGAFSGSYCAKLETIQESTGGEVVKMAGVLTLGIFDINIIDRTAIVKGGDPFTQRPTHLTGYYKYFPSGNDSCGIQIVLTKYNSAASKTDTVGFGQLISGLVADWTLFSVPVEYYTTSNPDTLNIVFISSDTSIFNVGSALYIDSIGLEGVNSVLENNFNSNVRLYPNPANEFVNLEIPENITGLIRYELFDISGKLLKEGIIEDNDIQISLQGFTAGSYILKILRANKIIESKKFTIK